MHPRTMHSWAVLLLLVAFAAADPIRSSSVDDLDAQFGNASNPQMRFGKGAWDKIKPNWAKKIFNSGMVKYINSKVKGFKAKVYPMFEGLTMGEFKRRFLGTIVDGPEIEKQIAQATRALHMRRALVNSTSVKKRSKRGADPDCIPKHFDARKKWPYCKDVIEDIQEQASCGSCWAVSSAAAFTDRRCIASKGKLKERLSAWDLVECCVDCRGPGSVSGCAGGLINKAAKFYVDQGVVTGDRYKGGGCKPYPVAPNGEAGSEFGREQTPTPCQSTCAAGYTTQSYSKDKHFASKDKFILGGSNLDEVMKEIMTNGPVVNAMDVYEDFQAYGGKIYRHLTGGNIGGHATKIIGWGEENGEKYWLVVNSWGKTWGENGMYRILRGTNEANIERYFIAADAKAD